MSLLRRREMMQTESHTELDYLEAVDLAYIDTEYIPTDNTAFEFEAMFSERSFIQYGAIISDNGYQRFHGGCENDRIVIYISSHGSLAKTNDGLYHKYYISRELCRLDDNEQAATIDKIPEISLYIMNRNARNINQNFSYKINRCRYAKIYENDELVRHYIPVLKGGMYCMYEQIQGKYYYNVAGVGYFTGG